MYSISPGIRGDRQLESSHIQHRKENHTGISAKPLHHDVCRIETQSSEDLQFQTYRLRLEMQLIRHLNTTY